MTIPQQINQGEPFPITISVCADQSGGDDPRRLMKASHLEWAIQVESQNPESPKIEWNCKIVYEQTENGLIPNPLIEQYDRLNGVVYRSTTPAKVSQNRSVSWSYIRLH
jgi:hypothetical protein